MVVHHFVRAFIEPRGEVFFGQRHAYGVGNALPERAGGRFHAGCVAVFGVAGGAAAPLAEIFEFVERQVVAVQVQQAVDQHTAVAGGEHKAVAVGPFGVGGVMFQKFRPEYGCHVGHAERHARVTGIGGFHAVNGESADGIGDLF